jgi:hypothetical protein
LLDFVEKPVGRFNVDGRLLLRDLRLVKRLFDAASVSSLIFGRLLGVVRGRGLSLRFGGAVRGVLGGLLGSLLRSFVRRGLLVRRLIVLRRLLLVGVAFGRLLVVGFEGIERVLRWLLPAGQDWRLRAIVFLKGIVAFVARAQSADYDAVAGVVYRGRHGRRRLLGGRQLHGVVADDPGDNRALCVALDDARRRGAMLRSGSPRQIAVKPVRGPRRQYKSNERRYGLASRRRRL